MTEMKKVDWFEWNCDINMLFKKIILPDNPKFKLLPEKQQKMVYAYLYARGALIEEMDKAIL